MNARSRESMAGSRCVRLAGPRPRGPSVAGHVPGHLCRVERGRWAHRARAGCAALPCRGAVTLVVLTFLAVLGLGLAGYLATSNQAMRLANRGYARSVSRQLAEMGLERALWAVNRNDWSGWTLAGTTATRTLTFPAGKYGTSGLTGAIKLQIDNYSGMNPASAWSPTFAYSTRDIVGRNGTWYRCLRPHASSDPATDPATDQLDYWAPELVGWAWNGATTYAADDVVNYQGAWYRATSGSTNAPPPSAAWVAIPRLNFSWSSTTTYNQNEIVYYPTGNQWYRCTTASTTQTPGGGDWQLAEIAWRWSGSTVYRFNDLVYYNATWYRYISSTVGSNSTAPPSSSLWASATTPWDWAAGAPYNLNDVVYRSGLWYRCILAHSGQAPPNATYWSPDPAPTPSLWSANLPFAADDVVRVGTVWYRCTAPHLAGTTFDLAKWQSATAAVWNPLLAYAAGQFASDPLTGRWYRCLVANTGASLFDPNYWAAAGWPRVPPVVYSEGVATPPAGAGAPLRTQVRAGLDLAPPFPNAVTAAELANLSSTGTIDSYDSSLGAYGDPNLGNAATVAGGNTTSTAVSVTSVRVNGYLAAPSASAPPYAPLYSAGSSAIVTDQAAPAVPSPKIDLSRVSRSPYLPFPDRLPINGGTTLPSGLASTSFSLGVPGASTPAVYRLNASLNLNGSSPNEDVLTINGPVVLVVNGSLLTQGGRIVISATGSATIIFTGQLYIGTNSANTGIDNQTLDPRRLLVVGTNTVNSSAYNYFWATRDFHGVLYLPDAYLHLWNSGSAYNATDRFGAFAAKNVYFNHAAKLHYDTALRTATFPGLEAAAIITQWRELTDPAEQIVFP